MPGRRAIGVDMGGTKLLAGAVDSRLSVHHRVQRSMNRLDQSFLLDLVVEAVEEARDSAGGEVSAVGFGIPALIDQRTGNAVLAVNLPLKDIMFADVMTERLGLPVFVDNDANLAARGGGVVGAGELLLSAARSEMLRRALPPSRDIVEIVPAAFGVEAGMIGAAALAIDGLAQVHR